MEVVQEHEYFEFPERLRMIFQAPSFGCDFRSRGIVSDPGGASPASEKTQYPGAFRYPLTSSRPRVVVAAGAVAAATVVAAVVVVVVVLVVVVVVVVVVVLPVAVVFVHDACLYTECG